MSDKCKKACTFASHLTPKQKNKIAKLIGERCLIGCTISGQETTALWDTGSQICLLSTQWLIDNGFDIDCVCSLSEIIGRDLDIEGVSGFKIPYEGYTMMTFAVNEKEVEVPFLVTKESIKSHIIGYNVISCLVSNDVETGTYTIN